MNDIKKIYLEIKKSYPPMLNTTESTNFWAEVGIAIYENYLGEEEKLNYKLSVLKNDISFISDLMSKKEKDRLKKIGLSKRILTILEDKDER